MNPALQDSIRQLIEQILSEKDFVSTHEVSDLVVLLVGQTLAAEFGINLPIAPKHPTDGLVAPIKCGIPLSAMELPPTPDLTKAYVEANARMQTAPPQPRRGGRVAVQTEEEKKAKRAAYQREYRSRLKTKDDTKQRTATASTPRPAPASASMTSTATPAPKKPVANGGNGAGPAPIAYVEAIDLGDL